LQTISDPAAIAAAVACAVVGAVIDLRTRRIPNLLTLPAAALGILFSMTGYAGQSVGSALLGLVLGAVFMLPGYMWGGTGAGDVKLMAAVGSLLGPSLVMRAFLASAVAGGVLAVAVAISRGQFFATVLGAARMIAARTPAPDGPDVDARRFAYGPAIAVGTMLAVVRF
jgi:prepilin peptidase CpaA